MFYSPIHCFGREKRKLLLSLIPNCCLTSIYVFSVTQLSHYLLHNLTWEGLLKETILWFAVWMLWQHTIWVTNWFNPDTLLIRILLFISMLVGLVMAAAIPYAFTYRGLIFAVCYVLIQAGEHFILSGC